MTGVSTHVLDISLGKPAAGVGVRLADDSGGEWLGVTDAEGRCRDLLNSTPLKSGNYRLIFAVAPYFEARQIPTLYPEIAITFQVRDPNQHHHIPLLLAPNGYTTYRGT
jgi:5-hydroxyisourate hydrolase